jgi:hypothetical protein
LAKAGSWCMNSKSCSEKQKRFLVKTTTFIKNRSSERMCYGSFFVKVIQHCLLKNTLSISLVSVECLAGTQRLLSLWKWWHFLVDLEVTVYAITQYPNDTEETAKLQMGNLNWK